MLAGEETYMLGFTRIASACKCHHNVLVWCFYANELMNFQWLQNKKRHLSLSQ